MSRATDYLRTSQIIKEIDDNREKYLIIHYSCESFYDNENTKSKKITSIAIRNLNNGQTNLFAIHKTAEIENLKLDNTDSTFEVIERKMLDDFYKFVENSKDHYYWIHWKMRDSNFGFQAIEHRYKVLGGDPIVIPDKNKICLSNLIADRYTKQYSPHPRMENLYKLNDIEPKDFLTGKEEARAFENKEYIKLSHSTASKVGLFSDFLTLLFDNNLKVNTPPKEIFGTSIQGIWLTFNNFKYSTPILWLLNTLISAVVGAWVSKWF